MWFLDQKTKMGGFLQSKKGVVQEVLRIHRSLPPRPGVVEVDAAKAVVAGGVREEQASIDAIVRQEKGSEVPDELFALLKEMQKSLVGFMRREQRREADRVLDLEGVHVLFDEMVQRVVKCTPSSSFGSVVSRSRRSSFDTPVIHSERSFGKDVEYSVVSRSRRSSLDTPVIHSERSFGKDVGYISRDDSYLKAKPSIDANGNGGELSVSRGLLLNSWLKPSGFSEEDTEKLSFIKLASLIEVSSKEGARSLDLQNKLMDQVDWLPDSIGKLSDLITLDLSENRIVVLPDTIGHLSSLRKLDLHSNRIVELPQSIGDLFSVVQLDLRGNHLTSLPSTIGKLANLEELDLSSNNLFFLPDSIGNLISLQKLNIETNDLEELPHTIGNCASLIELRAEYNRLKGLPEVIGRLISLEILNVRYNNIKGLPTTMASLSKLRELDVSFNELESVPESLCLATKLLKLNLGNNFADLQSLPRSIGNLELLEELDISHNQIRALPDSFGMLSQLYVLHAEENPWEVPPKHIAEMGAQDVVLYMAEHVAKRDIKSQPVKNKKTWAQLLNFSRHSTRKNEGRDYVKPLNIRA